MFLSFLATSRSSAGAVTPAPFTGCHEGEKSECERSPKAHTFRRLLRDAWNVPAGPSETGGPC